MVNRKAIALLPNKNCGSVSETMNTRHGTLVVAPCKEFSAKAAMLSKNNRKSQAGFFGSKYFLLYVGVVVVSWIK